MSKKNFIHCFKLGEHWSPTSQTKLALNGRPCFRRIAPQHSLPGALASIGRRRVVSLIRVYCSPHTRPHVAKLPRKLLLHHHFFIGIKTPLYRYRHWVAQRAINLKAENNYTKRLSEILKIIFKKIQHNTELLSN